MYLRSLVQELWRRRLPGAGVILYSLYPLSIVYRICVEIRLWMYKKDILPSSFPPPRVISIGNLTVGGSGKTPFTIYLSRLLADLGYKVAVLSRGYMGKRGEDFCLVSNGEKVMKDPLYAGDEPYLIANKLNGIPVLTGKDRYKLSYYACKYFDSDIVVLDDGFQHLKIKRDLDILLITPDIFYGGKLLPMGRLREPLSSINRADVIIIKGRDFNTHILEHDYGKDAFSFDYQPICLREIKDNDRIALEELRGKRVLAVSGIAEPSYFDNTLKESGALVVEHLTYPDHHIYTQRDVKDIAEKGKKVDMVITTEKDGIKLAMFQALESTIYALEIDVLLNDCERFRKMVIEHLMERRK